MIKEYRTVGEFVELIDQPYQNIIFRIITDQIGHLEKSHGSSWKHQSWPGGYLDHVAETMNIGQLMWDAFKETGRLDRLTELREDEPHRAGVNGYDDRFTLSDVLLVLFLHDISKPYNQHGGSEDVFREAVVTLYQIPLKDRHRKALRYIHGEPDDEYKKGDKNMTPLGAFCHMCDIASARLFYQFPLYEDPWAGRKHHKPAQRDEMRRGLW